MKLNIISAEILKDVVRVHFSLCNDDENEVALHADFKIADDSFGADMGMVITRTDQVLQYAAERLSTEFRELAVMAKSVSDDPSKA